MFSSLSDKQRDLSGRIVRSLKGSGRLTDVVLDYVDAALFAPEPGRLAIFLKDESDSQRDSLLDLIFFPDQTLQIELEPLVADARCSADDEAAIHMRLMAQPVIAPVSMPDGRPLTGIVLPDFIKSQYLKRLNISWRIDHRLAAAIEKGVAPAIVPVVRVRLRNAGVSFSSSQLKFLCRFFERMADDSPDFLACLDLALSIPASSCAGGDIYATLIENKRALFRSLGQARQFERRLRHSNMETLMLQGVRAPHAPPNRLKRHMRLIDLMCMAIFGKTEAMEPPREEPVREVSDREIPAAVIRSLLG